MRERLIELLKKNYVSSALITESLLKYWEELADILLAEGVIVPPVKVGDTVYRIYSSGDYHKIFEAKVVSLEFLKDGEVYLHLLHYNGYTEPVPFAKYIHEILLTKEEAEQALDKLKGK